MIQPTLLSRVVVAVRHQRVLVTCILVIGVLVALLALMTAHKKYSATTTVLMVAEPRDSSNSQVSFTETKPLLSVDLPSLATDAVVLARFRRDIGESVSLEMLRSRIHAKVNLDSSIMPVQYTAGKYDAAISGANLLGDEIVRFYREIATTRYDSLIKDLNSQLAARRKELTRLDSELAVTARVYPYIDVGSPGDANSLAGSVYQRLIALRAERDELQGTVHSDATIASSAKRLIANVTPLAIRETVNNDVDFQVYRDQYARDSSALNHLKADVTDKYPALVELRQNVAREAGVVAAAREKAAGTGPLSSAAYVAALDAQAKAEGQLAGDKAKLQAEDDALAALKAQIGHGSVAIDAARLRRDHDNAEAAYATLANRLAKSIADRAEAASTGSVVVLDRAQFAQRAALSSGTVVAAIILFMAVWLALTIAVMVDSNQEWFHDSRTIETFYDAPMMGSLPQEASVD